MTAEDRARRYCEALVAAGVTPEGAREAADAFLRETQALARGQCPICGAHIQRKLDPRQVGVGCADDQAWFNYRCECGFMCDRAE